MSTGAPQDGYPAASRAASEPPGVLGGPPASQQLREALKGWWLELAEREVDAVVPKAVEYGSQELVDMGHTLALSQGRSVDDAQATELAVWFYALGKMQRWSAAVVRGDQVSNDTLHDLGVYVRMVQRCRDVGGWPHPAHTKETP